MEREFLLQVMADMPEETVEAILEEHRKEVDAYEEKLRQAAFDGLLKDAIREAGGRNHKAIAALLDMESLQASEDTQQAVQEAVAELKKECGYLFEGPAAPPYAPGTGTKTGKPAEPESLADALREKFRMNG